jgi:ribosome maturation factor RimP
MNKIPPQYLVVSAIKSYLCGRLKNLVKEGRGKRFPLFVYKILTQRSRGHRGIIYFINPSVFSVCNQKLLNMIQMQLEELIRHKFEEADWTDCFLIELTISPLKAVEVIIDADAGVNFDQCKKLSRFIENWLDGVDEENPQGTGKGILGDDYTLEVSSPGVGRPLKFVRQYPRNVGRTLEVLNTEGSVLTGVMTAADAEKITLEWEDIRKEGKKKIKEMVTKALPFSQIKRAIVMVKF